MRIQSLHIKNYRCFEDFDIDFDDRLTVLVGVNGSGKTAVLDALGFFLKMAGHPIKRQDIEYELPFDDIAIGRNPEDFVYHLELQPSSIASAGSMPFDIHYINTTNEGFQYRIDYNIHGAIGGLLATEKPLCVSYMAGRFILDEDSAIKGNTNTQSAYSAFENNFNRTIDYASTLSWFSDVDSDEARDMRDRGQKGESPALKAVRDALSKALLGNYERPRMQGHPSELVIRKKDTGAYFKVSQLSDGYRAMLALVMDLARRMAESRIVGEKPGGSPLDAPAIVLIDEVELHLHPAWQHTVLNTLMEIFPNTQFIVTTHSPQVLTSIPPKHVRALADGKAYSVDEQTEGATASRLLKHILGVDPRPQDLAVVRMLKEYKDLVYEEKWDAPEAMELKRKLDEHFGKYEPDLFDLELHVENSKWERGL